MFTVAIIGPDGVGKTTTARRLETALRSPAKYVYMGVNLESSNVVLPTTWLWLRWKRLRGQRPAMSGPRDPSRPRAHGKGLIQRSASALKSVLRLVQLIAEENFRQLLIWSYRSRGQIVLLDRDFFVDYYAYDVVQSVGRRLVDRLHGFFLRRFYRRPDMVVLLDAPAEVMFARKGEGTIELLDRRLREYRSLRGAVRRFVSVDATRPIDEVVRDVRLEIERFQESMDQAKPGGSPNRPTRRNDERISGPSRKNSVRHARESTAASNNSPCVHNSNLSEARRES